MKLIWPILRKDARRLWREIIVTLAILAVLTWVDSWRSDFTPGSIEGWLNLLLPFAWAYLIALVVLEDPLVGDRQFWVTLPCRWQVLLAAKACFVLAFIHIPYLISCMVILTARGFAPFSFAPQLLERQLLLLLCLTLPAIALATVVRNVTQFLLGGLLLSIAAILLVFGMSGHWWAPWMPADEARYGFALFVLTLGALGVILTQYARRAVLPARAAGTAAILFATLAFAWLPRPVIARVQCGLAPRASITKPLSLRVASEHTEPLNATRAGMVSQTKVTIAIPLGLDGVPESARVSLRQLSFRMDKSDERHDATTQPFGLSWPEPRLRIAAVIQEPPGQSWQFLSLAPALYDQLKGSAVTIRGTIIMNSLNPKAPVEVPIGSRVPAPTLGFCASSVVEIRPDQQALKVGCESPTEIPYGVQVTLTAANGVSWKERLGNAMTGSPYPQITWLSPLNRRDAFFHLTAEDVSGRAGSRWLAPVSALKGSRIVVTPVRSACDLISYELTGIRLADYLVR